MEKVYPLNNTNKHNIDLKNAIHYLPPEFDLDIICKAMKAVYDVEGKNLAIKWIFDSKNTPPSNFDLYWDDLKLTPYQKHDFDKYLNDHIYSVAKKTGWIPKALRKGKQIKKPPSKLKQAEIGRELKTGEQLDHKLRQIKEINLSDEQKSFIPPQVINKEGACYFHPYMKKDDIPEDEEDYLEKLDKIVDCEVHVEEAVEYIIEQKGRREDDIEVRYRLFLTNRRDKHVHTEASFEELTTKIRFSSFLVSKGFVKFSGKGWHFDKFHEFLINEQEYPTVKNLNSWGEYKPGEFLFENGIYDVKQNVFYPADDQYRIKKGKHFYISPSGSDSIRPPVFSEPNDDSPSFLAEKFSLWESFNGMLNVRVTLGFAVACIFSREIIENDDGFPLLFKFGERGTGKSSSMEWFMSLFGYRHGNRQAISKQTTIKGLKRNMTLPTVFPFFLDDYRDHEKNNQVPDMTSSFLQWYHRIGNSMASKTTDNQTVDTRMKASVVITGNDKPTDHAAISRMIILNYTKFLKGSELEKIPEISSHTSRFSEFIGLIFQSYSHIHDFFMSTLKKNKKYLADAGFQGRTVYNWAYVITGIECIPQLLPDFSHWPDEFEALRNEICDAIKKEENLQKETNPVHEFFDSLEHYATQRFDSASEFNDKYFWLDHRHFKFKGAEEHKAPNGEIYQGPVLYLHLKRSWHALLDAKAEITRQTSLNTIDTYLQNSSYFLNKSVQVLLTKSIGDHTESNVRCHVLNFEKLKEHEMLTELIDKAKEYDQNRLGRIKNF
ncbi:MAG: hypothetical protein WD059_04695 [Balneolaceae bacterium]